METSELDGAAFRCLEGCGFCCTMQPEVSVRELALLRKRFAPRPLHVTSDGDRTYLQLHNKCGACSLLERRACGAYDLRPQHCRYFPFHVHFAPEPEVYLNYTCRGVELAPGRDVRAQFGEQVVANAKPEESDRHLAEARATYAEFKRRARRAGAWSDAAPVLDAARALGPRLFAAEAVEEAAARAGEPAEADALHADALEPFAEKDVVRRPFYLTKDLRWLTFGHEQDGDGASLRVLEMGEKGGLNDAGRLDGLDGWRAPEPEVARGLAAYFARLARRGSFTGSVYALVDDSGYAQTVEQAAWARVAEVATDLVARDRILAALGVPVHERADEVARFYDTTFLDAPTIGGWL